MDWLIFGVIVLMEKRGYPRALGAAIVSNAASAAILIPPSMFPGSAWSSSTW